MSRSRIGLPTAAIVSALVFAACSSSSYPTGPAGTPAPADHRFPDWPGEDQPPPEPPREPYPDVEFDDAGVNPPVDPADDPLSTFAMDVDTAAYAIARRYLEDGNLPDRDSVRLEEYVNTFDGGYAAPFADTFAIHVDGAPTPFTSSRSLLVRIGVQSRADEVRQPVALTFVLDSSGSMASEGRLELVKDALRVLVDGLGPDDSVAIVAFGSDARVVLRPTSAAEPWTILDALESLRPDGSTNAQAGLELGYDMADLAHRPGVLSRVVLASDGVANVGLTDADSILGRIQQEVDAGIDLVTVGVGMGNFNDVLLEQLADHGNGFYAYVNDLRQAEELFGRELSATLVTVARDARVQVEWRPDAVRTYRLLGYENRSMADDDFRDPTVDAGEVGPGHHVTALYEIEPLTLTDGFLGTVRLRWIDPESGLEEQVARDIEVDDLARDYGTASAHFRLATTVAAFAEILRDSPWTAGFSLWDVAREADAVARDFSSDDQVQELRWLTEQAARLAEGEERY